MIIKTNLEILKELENKGYTDKTNKYRSFNDKNINQISKERSVFTNEKKKDSFIMISWNKIKYLEIN
jgi:hypothetical protein